MKIAVRYISVLPEDLKIGHDTFHIPTSTMNHRIRACAHCASKLQCAVSAERDVQAEWNEDFEWQMLVKREQTAVTSSVCPASMILEAEVNVLDSGTHRHESNRNDVSASRNTRSVAKFVAAFSSPHCSAVHAL